MTISELLQVGISLSKIPGEVIEMTFKNNKFEYHQRDTFGEFRLKAEGSPRVVRQAMDEAAIAHRERLCVTENEMLRAKFYEVIQMQNKVINNLLPRSTANPMLITSKRDGYYSEED